MLPNFTVRCFTDNKYGGFKCNKTQKLNEPKPFQELCEASKKSGREISTDKQNKPENKKREQLRKGNIDEIFNKNL